jgi:hypothetical protein
MGIIHIFKGNKKLAIKNFQEAKKGKFRFVEQLIVDINLSAFSCFENDATTTTMYPILKELYVKATTIGEYAYIIPTAINLALAEIKIGNTEEGIRLLESLEKTIKGRDAFELLLWYKTLYEHYHKNDHTKMDNLHQNFGEIVDYYSELYPEHPQVIYVTMEYWSDN